jgi:hypothetical protein
MVYDSFFQKSGKGFEISVRLPQTKYLILASPYGQRIQNQRTLIPWPSLGGFTGKKLGLGVPLLPVLPVPLPVYT